MLTAVNTSTTSTASKSSNATSAAANGLDKEAFLSLLCAQLENQDPTSSSSTDTNAMIQQLTSYSSLEQMKNVNDTLTLMQNQNSAIFQAQSAGLIGKEVQVTSASFSLEDGEACTLGVKLDSAAASVAIKIIDSTGRVVRTLDEGALTAGDHAITWDGKDDNGSKQSNGIYSVIISAKDASGSNVKATPSAYMRVDSVTFTDDEVEVTAGGQTFSLDEITKISA